MKLSAPLKLALGVYCTPPATIATLPLAPWVTALTVSVSPSRSLSFVSTLTVTAVSSAVVAVSLFATGASFTAITVIVTVATCELALPSLAV